MGETSTNIGWLFGWLLIIIYCRLRNYWLLLMILFQSTIKIASYWLLLVIWLIIGYWFSRWWFGGFHSHGAIPKWMLYFMENPDDWGVPAFMETPICIHLYLPHHGIFMDKLTTLGTQEVNKNDQTAWTGTWSFSSQKSSGEKIECQTWALSGPTCTDWLECLYVFVLYCIM